MAKTKTFNLTAAKADDVVGKTIVIVLPEGGEKDPIKVSAFEPHENAGGVDDKGVEVAEGTMSLLGQWAEGTHKKPAVSFRLSGDKQILAYFVDEDDEEEEDDTEETTGLDEEEADDTSADDEEDDGEDEDSTTPIIEVIRDCILNSAERKADDPTSVSIRKVRKWLDENGYAGKYTTDDIRTAADAAGADQSQHSIDGLEPRAAAEKPEKAKPSPRKRTEKPAPAATKEDEELDEQMARAVAADRDEPVQGRRKTTTSVATGSSGQRDVEAFCTFVDALAIALANKLIDEERGSELVESMLSKLGLD